MLFAGLLPMSYPFSFLIQPRDTRTEGSSLHTVSRALQHQSLVNKMPPQTCLEAGLMEAFSQLRFLFPDNFSLCQADKVLIRTDLNQ